MQCNLIQRNKAKIQQLGFITDTVGYRPANAHACLGLVTEKEFDTHLYFRLIGKRERLREKILKFWELN